MHRKIEGVKGERCPRLSQMRAQGMVLEGRQALLRMQEVPYMKEITPSLIKNLVDQPGVNQKLLYPQFK